MWTRREYLKAMFAAGATAGLGLPLGRAGEQDPDVILRITAKPDVVPIWKGEPTAVFRFAGEVMKSRQDALRPSGGYLGPTSSFGAASGCEFISRTAWMRRASFTGTA